MKRLYRVTIIYMLTLFAAFAAKAQQTYSISGAVSDNKGAPVPGATVFITNSKQVTATNNDGKFNFGSIQPGSYEVVIKMLGFNPVLQNITIHEKSVKIIAGLTPSVTALKSVTIKGGPDPMRGIYLGWFLSNFIGQTVNAEQCKLLNPDVLRFHFDKEKRILTASADELLIVENKALGYQLKYLLTDFEFNVLAKTCTIGGSPYFEELKGTPDQQKKWNENRQVAYLSSDRHFFRALINNTLQKDGFQVYAITSLAMHNTDKQYKREYEVINKLEPMPADPEKRMLFTYFILHKPYHEYRGYAIHELKDAYGQQKIIPRSDTASSAMLTAIPLANAASLFFTDHANFKTLIAAPKVLGRDTIRAKDTVALYKLYIVYTGEKESPLFYRTGAPISPFIKIASKNRQITEMEPLADTVTIDRNGGLTPAKGFEYTGYWAWQRIADLTPLDYFVDPVTTADNNSQPANEIKEEGPPGLKGVIAAIDTLRNRLPIEKLYLQTDKPYYVLGDTLRFKSYLLNADYLTPSKKSGLMYVELDNSNSQMVKRIMVPVTSGLSWGEIALEASDIPEGSYTLRAYTRWMLNFGEDDVFKKNIYISSINSSRLLVNAGFRLDSLAGKNEVNANLQFVDLNKDPLRLKDMQFRVVNGTHGLFKYQAATGMDGNVQFHFNLADKTAINNLYIQARQKGKGTDTTTLTIPVTINRPKNLDVQFMPEGGNLVADILTKVGFKAINEDGRGTDISGKIINSKNQTIAQIQTLHKGMGSFELTPETNESYAAVINLPNKTTESYPLPRVNSTGTVLRVTNKGDDSLQVIISSTTNSNTTINNNYYLIGQSRGVVCYAATIKFTAQTVKKTIPKTLFPTGVARFTLLDQSNIALNERIVYIDHNDSLNITVNTNKPNYTTRDSIALAIEVKDKDGNPVQGDFSLAITDNSQVKTDTTANNILNNLLFTSDLKGTVEEPGWYFEKDNNRITALDNLLLTQGWVGYDWKQVFNPQMPQPKYPAEKEFSVQGKLTNIFNKPIKQTPVTMLQKQPVWVMDTLTNDEGRFTFKSPHLFPTDSTYYLIQTKNKRGDNRSFNVGIDVDELAPPEFKQPKERLLPWYVNSDTLLLKNAGTKMAQIQAEENYKGEGHLLKEVTIKDKKIIPDSHNLNGPGQADIILDEKDMIKARNLTLAELLQQKFPRFTKDVIYGHPIYRLNNHIVVLIIDGVFVARLHFPVDLYMDMLTASEIKGIEIMSTAQFAMAYNPEFLHILMMVPDRYVPVFLEITTYSGHGALLRHVPGRYVYKPIPLSLPKEFYRPRYTIKNSTIAPGTDLRSTIHWQPNVITDADGKANVSFFSADKPADYTVIMEGTDLNGNLGYKRRQIKIISNTAATK